MLNFRGVVGHSVACDQPDRPSAVGCFDWNPVYCSLDSDPQDYICPPASDLAFDDVMCFNQPMPKF